jgi:hypothetical protein
MIKVYIGYDEREMQAANVAVKTLAQVTKGQLSAQLLDAKKLNDYGMLSRISDHRGGQDYDLISNAPKSTRFAISRFLTPLLAQSGWALFVDCDVVFREDPRHMLEEVDAIHAVNVVKHEYVPSSEWKMVNQRNERYHRKNWSSVMLFNCDHTANRRLSLRDINERRGLELHQFYWLHGSEIGDLDRRWNWLVGEQKEPDPDKGGGIAHFTLGGPFTDGWKGAEHDDIWNRAAAS